MSSPPDAAGETGLPGAVRRLFPETERPDGVSLDLRAHAPHVIGRVLEDGDRRDLAWLFRVYGRDRLSAWLRQRGDRRLSRRSRAFWRVILDAGDAPGDAPGSGISDRPSELWPL